MSDFGRDCQPAADWILATPFDYYNTNAFLDEANKLGIVAMVIIFDTQIDAAGYYD